MTEAVVTNTGGAVAGTAVGAVTGQPIIPIPVVGAVAGAVVGGFVGMAVPKGLQKIGLSDGELRIDVQS